jgi:hypothetical protein
MLDHKGGRGLEIEAVKSHLESRYRAKQSRQVGRDHCRKEAVSVMRCLFTEFDLHTSSDATDPFTYKGIWWPSAVRLSALSMYVAPLHLSSSNLEWTLSMPPKTFLGSLSFHVTRLCSTWKYFKCVIEIDLPPLPAECVRGEVSSLNKEVAIIVLPITSWVGDRWVEQWRNDYKNSVALVRKRTIPTERPPLSAK